MAGNKSKLTILPTIDVEGTHGARPFEQYVLGDVGGTERWGVFRIAETLQEFGVQGTFFVDVYEYTLWGKESWRSVCEGLLERGQDVQLHSHPGWRSDDPRDRKYPWLQELKRTNCYVSDKRYLMTHLSYSEQLDMLGHGAGLLEDWTGTRPFIHRSGEYAANVDTLRALKTLGFKVDSSQNRAHPESDLALSYNCPALFEGLLEIPVTIYDRCIWSQKPWRATRKRTKTDLAYGFKELQKFCNVAAEIGLPIMNLFMHSFSLLTIKPYDRVEGPSMASLRNLQAILSWAKETPGIQIKSLAQFYASNQWKRDVAEKSRVDAVPEISAPFSLLKSAVKRLSVIK